MLSILQTIADGTKVVSNKKRSSGGNEPTVHTMPGQGGFQLSEPALSQLSSRKGDYVVLSQLPAEAAAAFGPDVEATRDGKFFLLYKGGTNEEGDTIGSKIALVGLNGQFSSVMPWEQLGGNPDSKMVYNLGDKVFGLAAIGDTLVPITAETDPDMDCDGCLVLTGDTDEHNQYAQVEAVQEVLDANRPFFMLTFSDELDKVARGESKVTTKGGKKTKEPVDLTDVEG